MSWVALIWLGFLQKPGDHVFLFAGLNITGVILSGNKTDRFHFPSFSVLLEHGDAVSQQVANNFSRFPFVPRKRGDIRSHQSNDRIYSVVLKHRKKNVRPEEVWKDVNQHACLRDALHKVHDKRNIFWITAWGININNQIVYWVLEKAYILVHRRRTCSSLVWSDEGCYYNILRCANLYVEQYQKKKHWKTRLSLTSVCDREDFRERLYRLVVQIYTKIRVSEVFTR